MSFITDLVGFTGSRDYQFVDTSGGPASRSAITTAIVTALENAGWTRISGPTANAFGDEYEWYSGQSPWYDTTNVPSWYLGGRAYLKLCQPNGLAFGFQVGEYHDGSIENEMTGVDRFDLTIAEFTTGVDFRVLANPYEMYIWPGSTSTISNATFYAGALNIPKPMQQHQRAISCILGTRLRANQRLVGSNGIYSCWRDRDGSQQFYQGASDAKVRFCSVRSGYIGGINVLRQTGRRIWNRATDLNMSAPDNWWPFFVPAMVAFPIGAYTNDPTFNGFMWDSVVISEAFTLNSTLRFVNKEWVIMAGAQDTASTEPAVLAVNFGASGDTLT